MNKREAADSVRKWLLSEKLEARDVEDQQAHLHMHVTHTSASGLSALRFSPAEVRSVVGAARQLLAGVAELDAAVVPSVCVEPPAHIRDEAAHARAAARPEA